MESLILAFDPSVRSTGVCRYQDGAYMTGVFAPKEKTPEALMGLHEYAKKEVSVALDRANRLCRNLVIVIEGYQFNMKGGKGAYSIEAGAMVRLACTEHGHGYEVVSTAQWKKEVLLPGWYGLKKGTKKKDALYLEHIYKSTGKRFDTTDEADAYCIAQYILRRGEA